LKIARSIVADLAGRRKRSIARCPLRHGKTVNAYCVLGQEWCRLIKYCVLWVGNIIVSDRVLLSASPKNIEACVALAKTHGLGIEMMAFAYPDTLDNDWQSIVAEYRTLLRDVPGLITMHGPFFDMVPGSIDRKIEQITMERYQQAVRIAADVGAKIIVFHANFIAAIRTDAYRQGWQERNVVFWHEMAAYAEQHDVTLAVENMWEFDPYIIGDVLRRVEHPRLRACLDVGHAHLFSKHPFEEWLKALEPYLVHLHLNNNPGDMDIHQGLHDGVLDYAALLPKLRALPNPPSMTLEMDRVEDMRASLDLLQLPLMQPR
jgi:sugar phosphate isomerase/epimerase